MTHPNQEILSRFSQGELDEEAAVLVALHLDDCPRCASTAARQDPLDLAFAAVEEPAVPAELAEQVLEAASAPIRSGPEVIVAAMLFLAGLSVLLLGGSPAELLSRAILVLRALSAMTSTVLGHGGLVLFWLGLASALLGLSIVAIRRLDSRRSV